MENSNDQQFDQKLNRIHREQAVAVPEFDTIWSAAEGAVKTRSVRRRRIRAGMLAAVCIVAVVALRPWAEQQDAETPAEQTLIDFAHLQRVIDEELRTPEWTEPSPTQFLVELSPQPDFPSYQILN
ncbi:MAG: hypothetical protein ACR2NM_01805 [Bythopirellula sp.]